MIAIGIGLARQGEPDRLRAAGRQIEPSDIRDVARTPQPVSGGDADDNIAGNVAAARIGDDHFQRK